MEDSNYKTPSLWKLVKKLARARYLVLGSVVFTLGFAQRLWAAFLACSLRCSAVRFLADALPPSLPSLTAAGSFRAI